MVNSITTAYIRGLIDSMGITSKVDNDGDIIVLQSADEDFHHDVVIFLHVHDNRILDIYAFADFTVSQSQVANTIIKINECNRKARFVMAYLDDKGRVGVSRSEMLDENVSDEFIKENCLKMIFPIIWNFYKENFGNY